MKVVQVKLKSGNSEMVTWVENRKTIVVGNRLTLKEDKDKWYDIVEVYKNSVVDSESLHSDWNVGGL